MKKREGEKKSGVKDLLLLFLLFMKIGLFTFGGGYAMISLIRREFIEKRKWITAPEFTDMIAISESTPGPLAINSATYVGYKIGGFWGALVSTVGVVIPSFVIIYVISLFLEQFLELTVVAAAFKGIQVAVAVLILTAGIKMFREMEKKPVTVAMAALVFIVMILLDVFALSFSSVWLILIGAGVGLAAYFIGRIGAQRAPAAGKSAGESPESGEKSRENGETPSGGASDAENSLPAASDKGNSPSAASGKENASPAASGKENASPAASDNADAGRGDGGEAR